jgi:hypothetical protein
MECRAAPLCCQYAEFVPGAALGLSPQHCDFRRLSRAAEWGAVPAVLLGRWLALEPLRAALARDRRPGLAAVCEAVERMMREVELDWSRACRFFPRPPVRLAEVSGGRLVALLQTVGARNLARHADGRYEWVTRVAPVELRAPPDAEFRDVDGQLRRIVTAAPRTVLKLYPTTGKRKREDPKPASVSCHVVGPFEARLARSVLDLFRLSGVRALDDAVRLYPGPSGLCAVAFCESPAAADRLSDAGSDAGIQVAVVELGGSAGGEPCSIVLGVDSYDHAAASLRHDGFATATADERAAMRPKRETVRFAPLDHLWSLTRTGDTPYTWEALSRRLAGGQGRRPPGLERAAGINPGQHVGHKPSPELARQLFDAWLSIGGEDRAVAAAVLGQALLDGFYVRNVQ